MPLSDEERRELTEALEQVPEMVLEVISEGMQTLVHGLQDANSCFPATREFLQARGLTNVRQLDARGKEELLTHLKAVLRGIAN